jgi:integrase
MSALAADKSHSPKAKKTKKEADRVFHRLMAGDTPAIARPYDVLVVTTLDLFLEHAHLHNAPRTYEWYRSFLQDISNRCGSLRVEVLKPFRVNRWLDSHADWDTARWGAITAVKRAFNWVVYEGLIANSPVKKVKKPPMPARDRFLTTEERGMIRDNYRDGDPFREFLFAMEQTGSRPGEVALVTADHVDLNHGVWVFEEHKTRSKTGTSAGSRPLACPIDCLTIHFGLPSSPIC